MSKSDTGWLIVRLLGLLAALKAALEIPLIYIAIHTAFTGELGKADKGITSDFIVAFAGPCVSRLVLFGLLAFYLLRRGRIIHAALMYEQK